MSSTRNDDPAMLPVQKHSALALTGTAEELSVKKIIGASSWWRLVCEFSTHLINASENVVFGRSGRVDRKHVL